MPSTVTALPTPPSRDDPSTFASRGDAFLGALPDFVTELNAVAGEVSASSIQTAADRVQTGLDRVATAADRVQTGLDRALLVSLDALWLGTATSDPSTGKAGAALVAGNAYVNSSTGYLRAYNGSTWVQGISAVAGVSTVNGNSGAITGIATTSDLTAERSATATLTNKTLTGYTETVYAVTGTTPVISAANGSIQTWTLTGNSTPTYSINAGQSIILMITAGANTITWPTTSWSKVGGGGAAPTLTSSGATCVILWKVGSVVYGALLGSV